MSIRLKLSLLLLVLFTAAIGNAIFTFILEDYGEEKLDWVVHTHEVINESEKLLSSMTDAETGQRGYLLTGDIDYLEPYRSGLISSETSFNNLTELTSDNPDQKKRLERIQISMKKKLEELDMTIQLRQQGSREKTMEAVEIVRQDSGKKYMDSIRRELVGFENEERLLLEIRNGNFRESRAQITTMVAVELIFFVFLGLITANFVRDKLFSPLGMLLASTSKMALGEKQDVGDILPKDEMGYLLSRFYKMSEAVYSRTEDLTYDATHDALTGLKNRTGIEKEIADSIAALAGSDRKTAVLFIDLNEFKQLNDTLGHDAGDAILKETANRLREPLRSDDVVFRLGGDEFVVVLKNIARSSHAKTIVANVLEGFAAPFIFEGNSIEISPSIGIAISPDDATNSEEALRFADIAMYAAKSEQGTNYRFFDKSMMKRASDE